MSRSIALLAAVLALIPASVAHGAGSPLVRKDVADLTAAERAAFVDALLELKATPSPYDARLSWYDQIVAWHVYLATCDPLDPLMGDTMRGHGGPMFLPWHRQYLLMLEHAMRAVTGRRIAVPYWDWTDPESTRAVFREDFMGGDGDPRQDFAVTTGPFRKGRWRLEVLNRGVVWGQSATRHITRHFGSFALAPTLPTAADEARALRPARYDVAPYSDASDPRRSFRQALEGYRNPVTLSGCLPDGTNGTVPLGEAHLHNRAHVWVGGVLHPSAKGVLRLGTLAANVASPNDPVFFLLHANVDRIWAAWQDLHGTDTYRPLRGLAHNSERSLLRPFEQAGTPVTPADVADIADLGYRYAGAAQASPVRAAPLALTDLVCSLKVSDGAG